MSDTPLKNISTDHLFLRAARGEQVERPPVWLMRQAGRILPQYRALRANFPDFKAFVKTPEAAAEATIQPVDELGVDAAIIFSDILVVPEAMGLDYKMVESVGPRFPTVITGATDVKGLRSGQDAAASLEYVFNALRVTKKALNGRVPLIGFAGAPWTIFAYMLEGGGSKTFSKARRMLYADPALSHQLLEKITTTTIAYLKGQIAAGADLLQLFDSWAGELPPAHYREFAVPYLQRICEALPEVPKTVFAKGAWFALEDLGEMSCQVVGLDWNTPPAFARARVGADKVLQGNLDPCTLYAQPEVIREATLEMLRQFGPKHIANLGHGVYPDTPLEGVRTFVNTVKGL
ncbi:MAG: uroporphyrinogen decarboxylase [Lewinellaceae bacterium]|nr:uroporphyrinogen decarboxylase [Lewinellaceae bacterium]